MDIHLHDATAEPLAGAIQRNLLGWFRMFGRAPSSDFREEDGIARWRTVVPHPWFNGVISARPARVGDEAFIQDTVAYFDSRGVSGFTWWLEPEQKGAGWEDMLVKAGFQRNADTPGMALDLQTLAPAEAPRDLRIAMVDDLPGLRAWCSGFARGYGTPLEWEKPLFDLLNGVGLGLPLRYTIGYLEGQAVSVSQLFLGGGVAGIYCVATLPEARGKGIGAALTLAPLLDARELGFRYGVLQSSEMGFGVYQRMGFSQYCMIEHYSWGKG